MAFRFKRKENVEDGFPRIARQQVARALREWQNPDRAVAIHETRKCVKRLRSLLRLIKPALSSQDYLAENAFLREIGRSLSVSRDTQVLQETIQLLQREANTDQLESLERLGNLVQDSLVGAQGETAPNTKNTANAIRQAGARLTQFETSETGFDLVAAGLEKTYRQCRQRMGELIIAHTDEASHDWRKRVQAHWRQLRLLSAAWPEMFETRIALARNLSYTLGLDHDLALLEEFSSGHAAEAWGKRGQDEISNLIRKRQQELRVQSLRDGRVLFADPPKPFAKQIRRLWDVAQQQPKHRLLPRGNLETE